MEFSDLEKFPPAGLVEILFPAAVRIDDWIVHTDGKGMVALRMEGLVGAAPNARFIFRTREFLACDLSELEWPMEPLREFLGIAKGSLRCNLCLGTGAVECANCVGSGCGACDDGTAGCGCGAPRRPSILGKIDGHLFNLDLIAAWLGPIDAEKYRIRARKPSQEDPLLLGGEGWRVLVMGRGDAEPGVVPEFSFQ